MILETKISSVGLHSRLDRIEERSVNRNTNYPNWNVMRKTSVKTEQILWDLWVIIKSSNTHAIEVQEEDRKNGAE